MEDRPYSSLSRHGLASSYSYLDGVPFKISANFRQPPQVISLSEILQSNVHVASNLEYNFETEEGVLRWAQARTEAAQKQAILQEQKEEKELETNGSNAKEVDGAQSQMKVPQKPSVAPRAIPTAKTLSEVGTILKPVPIHPLVVKKSDLVDTQSRFDVSMFESEDDPFDNLELQTLNDFEELKVVLDSSSRNSNPDSTGAVSSDLIQTDCSSSVRKSEEIFESVYDMATVISDQDPSNVLDSRLVLNNIEPESIRVGLASATNTLDENSRRPDSFIKDIGEYVELVSPPNCQNNFLNGVHYKSPSPTNWSVTNSVLSDGEVPSVKSFKPPVLPPISHSVDMVNEECEPSTELTNSFIQNSVNIIGDNPSNCSQGSSGPSSHFTDFTKSQFPPAVAPKPTLKNPQPGARMWSSFGPTSAVSLDDNSSSKSKGVLIGPYSRHHLSTSDFELSKNTTETNPISPSVTPLPSIQQNVVSVPWNKHRPLPPPPTFKPTAETSTSSNAKPLGLGDPYSSLSTEDKMFVDSLTSMGFKRPRVSRAVAKFGRDEKEVLDHLLAVDQLVEKKYAPVFVESALQTYRNDVVKAEKFLAMLTSFEELGFSGDRIKEALIATDMDHEKSLDMLTA